MGWKERVGVAILVGSAALPGCDSPNQELLPDGSAPVVTFLGLANSPGAFVGRRVQVLGFSKGETKVPDSNGCTAEKPFLIRRVLAPNSNLATERGVLVVEYCVNSGYVAEDPQRSSVRPVWARGTVIERPQVSPKTTHTFVAEAVR